MRQRAPPPVQRWRVGAQAGRCERYQNPHPTRLLNQPPNQPPSCPPTDAVPTHCPCRSQALCRDASTGLEPWVGLIVGPYDTHLESPVSQHQVRRCGGVFCPLNEAQWAGAAGGGLTAGSSQGREA